MRQIAVRYRQADAEALRDRLQNQGWEVVVVRQAVPVNKGQTLKWRYVVKGTPPRGFVKTMKGVGSDFIEEIFHGMSSPDWKPRKR